jgi:LPS-assembly protein
MTGDRRKGGFSDLLRASWLALLALLLLVAPAAGQQGLSLQKADKGPIHIVSDRLAYDQESDTYRAEGDVVITFTGGYLKADTVTLNRTTNDAWAHGHALLFSEGDTLEGDVLEINLETKKGMVNDGRMFFVKNHLYVTGREIEKYGESTYRIKDATATTCEGPIPDWRFTSKEADVTIDGYGTLKNGTFQIHDTPVAWFPWALIPAKTSRQSGFLFPYMGYSQEKLGLDVDIPFYWAISDSYDATLHTRYMSMRGLQEGLEFRYHPTSSTWGLFYGDFLKDQWTGTDTSGGIPRTWTEKQDRWSWYWSHETTFEPGFTFRTDLMKISDIYYFRDFTSHNYYLDNFAGSLNRPFHRISFVGNEQLTSYDSTARIVKQWRNYNLTALTQYTENLTTTSNAETLQRYPEITFTGFKQPLFGTRLNWDVTSLYGYYYRDYGVKGSAFDIYPKVSLPWAFGSYATVTPELGFRETLWDTSSNNPAVPGASASRALYTVSLGATTEAFRIFDVNWGSIQKIRHAVKPEVTYFYVPIVDQTVRPDFVTGVDSSNSVTYALTNTLIGRSADEKGNVTYRELTRLKLSQTYNITTPAIFSTTTIPTIPPTPPTPLPADPTAAFLPLNIELDINPYQYLGFTNRSAYDFNTTSWSQIQQDIYLKDTRGDSLAFVYRYTKNSVESYGIAGRIRAANSIDVFAGLRENLFDRTTLEKTIGLEYRGQCWSVEVSYSDLVSDRSFMILFSLTGLGRVGGLSASNKMLGF